MSKRKVNAEQTQNKRKAPPSPPRLAEAEALAAYCHECFRNPGEACQNYLGHAKPPCRSRGHVQAAAAPIVKPRGLFDDDTQELCDILKDMSAAAGLTPPTTNPQE